MGKTAVSWADVSSSSSVLRFFLRLVMICYIVIEVLAWYLDTFLLSTTTEQGYERSKLWKISVDYGLD